MLSAVLVNKLPLHAIKEVCILPLRVLLLQGWLDALDDQLPPLRNFILPSGGKAAAHLHMARSVRYAMQCIEQPKQSRILCTLRHQVQYVALICIIALAPESHALAIQPFSSKTSASFSTWATLQQLCQRYASKPTLHIALPAVLPAVFAV
jgi:hypothetical protein